MRYFQVTIEGDQHLVAERKQSFYDLTAARPELKRFLDLAKSASIGETSIDEVAVQHLDEALEIPPEEVEAGKTCPVVPDEVWAAGVTYAISEQAREEESGMPEMYLDVYEADRPEVFFKATASRTVGPSEDIGVREDSDWNVPEPELGIVLYRGQPVGYTVGNDVSSRDIEGANPLYLPQAKVYDRCCAIGPCVASPDIVGDPHDLKMSMQIERGAETVFEGETSTSEMVRTCEELVQYYTKHNAVPELTVLLTGTTLVPEDEFDLRPDDEVVIDLERVGSLRNRVRSV